LSYGDVAVYKTCSPLRLIHRRQGFCHYIADFPGSE